MDEGAVIREGVHRTLWIEDDGQLWMTVLKRTRHGEVYQSSYRRSNRHDLKRLRRKRGSNAAGGNTHIPSRTRRLPGRRVTFAQSRRSYCSTSERDLKKWGGSGGPQPPRGSDARWTRPAGRMACA